MHISFINMPIEFYSPVSGGAIATVIMNTGRELEARGHEVSVLTVVNGDELYPVGKIIPIQAPGRGELNFLQRRLSSLRSRLRGWDWPYYGYYLRSVRRELAALNPAPDVTVVCNDLVSPKYIKDILPGTKVICWLHNEWRTRFDLEATVRNTDLFVTCSEYIRTWTSQTHRIPQEHFAVGHNGVDHAVFKPRGGGTDFSDALRVLFLGRIDPNKGPDIAADAVAKLREEGLAVKLTVAGGLWFYDHGNEMRDPFFRLLKSKMESAGAEYLGHVTRDRVPELARNHDVACVLSRSNEPFGLVALEAMASGCAVIASGRGGLPEACGGAGMLVDPDDFEAVTSALRALATDRALLDSQKRKSLERAARASWSECAGLFERASGEERGNLSSGKPQAAAA